MQNNTKFFIGGIAAALILGFATGRFTSVGKKTETHEEAQTDQSKTANKKQIATDTDQNKHTDTTTEETFKPDGTRQVNTHTITDTNLQKKSNTTDQSVTQAKRTDIVKDSKITESKSGNLTVGILAGLNFSQGLNFNTPDYGILISNQLIGPVNIGVWGMKSLQGGVLLSVSLK